MERVVIQDGLSLSRLVYGLWRLTEDDTAPEAVRGKIDACLDAGITTFDQADIYGGYTSEAVFGRALTPALRNRMEIVTKCGIVAPVGRHTSARLKHYDTSRGHIEASVDQSLTAMGTDRVDLLLIHRPDPMMDQGETGAALDALVTAGKVRAVGVSNFRPWDVRLLQSAMTSDLVVNQIELSLSEIAPFANGDLAFLQENRIVPMAWSPLGGGALTSGAGPVASALAEAAEAMGLSVAATALAWLMAHPAEVLPVIGTTRPERIADLARAAAAKMDRQMWFALYSAALGSDVP